MYIGVVLLCQAHFAHHTLFPVLIPNLCLVLKILQKMKALVLMMKLLMQKLGNQPGMMAGRIVPAQAKIPMLVIQRVLVRLCGSVVAPHKLRAIGK